MKFIIYLLFAVIMASIVLNFANAQTYFADNFDNPNESQKKWVDIYGQWEFKNKEYHQLLNAVNCMSVVADEYWNDD